jgi:hypothetical protein
MAARGKRDGLSLLRISGKETRYLGLDFTPPRQYSGSLLDLEPDSTYEILLKNANPHA